MSTTAAKLSVREKVGYSLGDLAANLIFQTLITFLTFFYTDVYRIPAAYRGTDHLCGRDGRRPSCSRPIIGLLADRTQTRWGKFRPWILWTSVPFGVLALLAFSTPDLGEQRQGLLCAADLHPAGARIRRQQSAVCRIERRADRQHGRAQQPVCVPLRGGDGGAVHHPGAAVAAGADPGRRRQGGGLRQHDDVVRDRRHGVLPDHVRHDAGARRARPPSRSRASPRTCATCCATGRGW